MAMSRQQVYKEIEQTFGLVPGFIQQIPDDKLELEWKLFLQTQFAEGPIPNKYRELIGVAIAAVARCRYCAYFHSEAAKLNGATKEEIEDAVHFAKSSAGWSAYINGLQLDYKQFCSEVDAVCSHVGATMSGAGAKK